MRMQLRNPGVVTAGCDPIEFVVAEKAAADALGQPHNLRAIRFENANADHVYVAHPVRTADNSDARQTDVNGYADQAGRPFVFDQKVALPCTLYLEGVRSTGRDAIGFEYQFYKGNQPACGSVAVGTVVQVEADFDIPSGGGAPFADFKKMLAMSEGRGEVTISPRFRARYAWTYRGDDAPFGAPNRVRSTFQTPNRADRLHTGGEVLLVIEPIQAKLRGQNIQCHVNATVTAPRRVTLPASPTIRPTGFLAPRANWSVDLLDVRLSYPMLDQFGRSIKDESAWGGARPATRENIRDVLHSPLVPVDNYVSDLANLNHTHEWKVKTNAEIHDRIRVAALSNQLLTHVVRGRRKFLPGLLNGALPRTLLDLDGAGTHIWYVGIRKGRSVYDGAGRAVPFAGSDSTGFPEVTHNVFVAEAFRQRVRLGTVHLRFQATYTVSR